MEVHPDCINASNNYNECVDYCYAKIADAKDRACAENLESEEEITRKLAERTVHLDCINASNPYHEFTEFCFIKIVEAHGKTEREKIGIQQEVGAPSLKSEVPSEEKASEDSQNVQNNVDEGYPHLNEILKMAKVHPDCINASNHYHESVDYCYAKIAEAKYRATAKNLECEEEIARKLAERTVHLDCINASNPYHECTEYCFIKIVEAKEKNEREKLGIQQEVGAPSLKSEVSSEEKASEDSQNVQNNADEGYPHLNEILKMEKVHPDCINVSIHYHEYVDYCYAKIAEAKYRAAAENLECEEEIARKLAERTVHLDCINASNPYHECTEYCFIKIVEAMEKNEREKLETLTC